MNQIIRLTFIFLFLFIKFFPLTAQPAVDSLTKLLNTGKADTNKVNTLVQLGYQLKKTDAAKALTYAEQAQQLASQLNFFNGLMESHNLQRMIYYNKKNYDEALKHARFQYEQQSAKGDIYKKGKAAYSIANIYFKQINYSAALQWYLEAFKNYEKVNSKYDIGIAEEQIGSVFLNTEEWDKALEYFQKSLNTAIEIKDSIGIALGYSNLGGVYGNQKKTKEAIMMYNKSLTLLEHLKDTATLIEVLNNMGVSYKKSGLYNEAVSSYKRCYELITFSKPVDSLTLSYLDDNIGLVYVKMHNNDLAALYLNRALSYALRVNEINVAYDSYNGLFEVNSNKGDYKQALDYHLKYIALRDSVFNVVKMRQINEMQARYEAEEKDLKINSLNQQNLVKEKELEGQRVITYSFVAGFILIFLFGLVLYNQSQIRKKSNDRLAKTNYELEKTLVDLKATQEQLVQQEKMASLGQLTAGIAHEIKNPLNFVTNFSELSYSLIDELKTADTPELRNEIIADLKLNLQKINEHGKRADNIVKSMLQHSRSGDEKKQPTDINALCDEFLNLAYHGMRASMQNFNSALNKELAPNLPRVNAIQNDISRVLLNLFNNAFYAIKERSDREAQNNNASYSPAVTIITKHLNNAVFITVRDNGAGIPDELKEKIFDPFFTTKPSGEGTGLGLSLSFDIIKAHGGDLKVYSKQGEGTEFIITLPV